LAKNYIQQFLDKKKPQKQPKNHPWSVGFGKKKEKK
jgi:hypothetical protein